MSQTENVVVATTEDAVMEDVAPVAPAVVDSAPPTPVAEVVPELSTFEKLKADVQLRGTYDLVFVPNTSGQDRFGLLTALRNEQLIASDALICYEFPCQTKLNQGFFQGGFESVHEIVVMKTKSLARNASVLDDVQQLSTVDSTTVPVPPNLTADETVKSSGYRQYVKSAESLQYATGGKSSSFGTIAASVIHILANTQAHPKPQDRVTNRSFSNVIFGDLRSKDGMASVLNLLQMNLSSRNCLIIGRGGPADQHWSAIQCTKAFEPTNAETTLTDFLNTECKFYNKNPRGPRVRASGLSLVTKYLARLRSEANQNRQCLKGASEIYHYILPCFELRALRSAYVPPVTPEPTTTTPTDTTTTTAPTTTTTTHRKAGPYVIDTFMESKGQFPVDMIFSSPALFQEFMQLPEVVALTESEKFKAALEKATATKQANQMLQYRFPDVGTMNYYGLNGVHYAEVVTRTQRDIERRHADRKKQALNQSADGTPGQKRKSRSVDRPKRVQSEKSANAGINACVPITPQFTTFIETHCLPIAEKVYEDFKTNHSLLPRTKIVQMLSKYAEENKLLDTQDRRKININQPTAAPLVELLRHSPAFCELSALPNFHLNRFNINKFIGDLIIGAKRRTKEEIENIRNKKKQNKSKDKIDLPKSIPKKGSLRNSIPDSALPVFNSSRSHKRQQQQHQDMSDDEEIDEDEFVEFVDDHDDHHGGVFMEVVASDDDDNTSDEEEEVVVPVAKRQRGKQAAVKPVKTKSVSSPAPVVVKKVKRESKSKTKSHEPSAISVAPKRQRQPRKPKATPASAPVTQE